MTSISSYRIYKTKCCDSEIRIANYASSNASTIFTTLLCNCKETTSVDELELIRIDMPSKYKLGDGGVNNYELPFFVKRK